MILNLNTLDFRRAVASVVPHVHSDPATGLGVLHFTVTAEHVYVQATNTASAGMAIVSVWEHEGLTGDPFADHFDLDPSTAKELLAVFKAGKNQPDDAIGDALRITVSPGEITFIDISGLFPGKAYSIPNGATTDVFPNLARVFWSAIAAERQVPARIVTNGKLLQLFAHAAASYKQPLAIEPTETNKRMLISCGDSFLGLLMPIRAEEGDGLDADLTEWRDGWANRLPPLQYALEDGKEAAA